MAAPRRSLEPAACGGVDVFPVQSNSPTRRSSLIRPSSFGEQDHSVGQNELAARLQRLSEGAHESGTESQTTPSQASQREPSAELLRRNQQLEEQLRLANAERARMIEAASSFKADLWRSERRHSSAPTPAMAQAALAPPPQAQQPTGPTTQPNSPESTGTEVWNIHMPSESGRGCNPSSAASPSATQQVPVQCHPSILGLLTVPPTASWAGQSAAGSPMLQAAVAQTPCGTGHEQAARAAPGAGDSRSPCASAYTMGVSRSPCPTGGNLGEARSPCPSAAYTMGCSRSPCPSGVGASGSVAGFGADSRSQSASRSQSVANHAGNAAESRSPCPSGAGCCADRSQSVLSATFGERKSVASASPAADFRSSPDPAARPMLSAALAGRRHSLPLLDKLSSAATSPALVSPAATASVSSPQRGGVAGAFERWPSPSGAAASGRRSSLPASYQLSPSATPPVQPLAATMPSTAERFPSPGTSALGRRSSMPASYQSFGLGDLGSSSSPSRSTTPTPVAGERWPSPSSVAASGRRSSLPASYQLLASPAAMPPAPPPPPAPTSTAMPPTERFPSPSGAVSGRRSCLPASNHSLVSPDAASVSSPSRSTLPAAGEQLSPSSASLAGRRSSLPASFSAAPSDGRSPYLAGTPAPFSSHCTGLTPAADFDRPSPPAPVPVGSGAAPWPLGHGRATGEAWPSSWASTGRRSSLPAETSSALWPSPPAPTERWPSPSSAWPGTGSPAKTWPSPPLGTQSAASSQGGSPSKETYTTTIKGFMDPSARRHSMV